jgi:hypothetical protein
MADQLPSAGIWQIDITEGVGACMRTTAVRVSVGVAVLVSKLAMKGESK